MIMNKIKKFLNEYGILITILILFVVLIDTCGLKTSIYKTNKRLDEYNSSIKTIDSTINTKISTVDLKKYLTRFGYEISKNILYDNNAIVRQITRPDDRMKWYDDEIKKLDSK